MKKERQDETEFTTKIGGKNQSGSQLFCFVKFSFLVTRLMLKLAVLMKDFIKTCPFETKRNL